jgi:hypothetical protein
MSKGRPHGCTLTLVALVADQHDALIFHRQLLQNLKTVVSAAIINYDHFKTLDQSMGQPQHATKARLYQVLLVVDRDQHREGISNFRLQISMASNVLSDEWLVLPQ